MLADDITLHCQRGSSSAGLKLQISAVWACVLPGPRGSLELNRSTVGVGLKLSWRPIIVFCSRQLFSALQSSRSPNCSIKTYSPKVPANRTESWLSAQCSLLGRFHCLTAKCILILLRGCGYIGSFTALALLEAGYKVVIADNLLNSSEETINRIELISGKRPEFFNVDIRKEEDFDTVFKAHPDIDSVIHFAALKVCLQNFLQKISPVIQHAVLLGACQKAFLDVH